MFNDQNKRPIIISLEGNIGAGKSTILANLEKHLGEKAGWIFLKEPIHIWDEIQDQQGQTILSKFYENPEKYAFAFQIMAYTTRLHELKRVIKENPDCVGIICERSLDADKHIFAKMLRADNVIDEVMYNIYERYFSEYEGDFTLDGMIYIEALPDICLQRVSNRSRDGESKISLEYLEKCHLYHTNWINNTNTEVLTLDVNDDVQNKSNIMESWLDEITNFVTQKFYKTHYTQLHPSL